MYGNVFTEFCYRVEIRGGGSKSASGYGPGGSKSASGYGPRGSKSASGYGPGGPYPLADLDRGVQFKGGPNPLGHRKLRQRFFLSKHEFKLIHRGGRVLGTLRQHSRDI